MSGRVLQFSPRSGLIGVSLGAFGRTDRGRQEYTGCFCDLRFSPWILHTIPALRRPIPPNSILVETAFVTKITIHMHIRRAGDKESRNEI